MIKIFAPHAVDFYKCGHPFMFPDGLEELYGNFTPRGDKSAKVLPDFDHKILVVGLQGMIQYLLIDLWNETFFEMPKNIVVQRYKRRMDKALGADIVPVEKIEALWEHGYLPLEIKAIEEGSRVNMRVPVYTVKSTIDNFAWVEQYVETQMSAEYWKPLTTATTAFEFRRLFTKYALLTGADLSFVPFQGHDFSMRGMSGIHDATTSGAAHLMVFKGTDTVSAIDYLEDFYRDITDPYIGGSVVATEHAVSSSNIIKIARALQTEGEWQGFKKEDLADFGPNEHWKSLEEVPILELAEAAYLKWLLTVKRPTGIFSYVSDTYDFWAVITRIAKKLKPEIMARDGKLVFRPDSGDPVKIVCGDSQAEAMSPEAKGAILCLWQLFGGEENTKGYRKLDSHVGLIYGDSISLERAQQIMSRLMLRRFSSDNIVFGIGSFTYQYVTRDTFGTAIKATHATIDGQEYDLFKDPKTDNGLKKSAVGLLRVEKKGNNFVLYDRQTREQEAQGELKTVFRNGILLKYEALSVITARIDHEIENSVMRMLLEEELV